MTYNIILLFYFIIVLFFHLDKISEYFGLKIGLYFAWLGHYTTALTVPALLGSLFWVRLICTLPGWVTVVRSTVAPRIFIDILQEKRNKMKL